MIHTDFSDTNKRALVLVSGGMDSRVCLQKAVHDLGSKNVVAVCTSYGQKHIKELGYARAAAIRLGVEFHISFLEEVFSYNKDCSALLRDSNRSIDQSSYEEQMREKIEAGEAPISNAYVPFRNGLLLSYATAVALQLNCQYVVYGAHSDDSNVMIETKGGKVQKCQAYPDCTSEFIEAMSEAIKQGTGGTVELVAPIYDLTKSQVALLGWNYGMTVEDFQATWSCYEGGKKECGLCGTCRDKIKALRSIGFTNKELSVMFDYIPKKESDWSKIKKYINCRRPFDVVRRSEMIDFIYEGREKGKYLTLDSIRRMLVVCGYLENTEQRGVYRVRKHIESNLNSSKLRKMYDKAVKKMSDKAIKNFKNWKDTHD